MHLLEFLYDASNDFSYALFSWIRDSGAIKDFSHSSMRIVAVRLMLLGVRRLTTLGKISSRLGVNIGVPIFDDFGLLNVCMSALDPTWRQLACFAYDGVTTSPFSGID